MLKINYKNLVELMRIEREEETFDKKVLKKWIEKLKKFEVICPCDISGNFPCPFYSDRSSFIKGKEIEILPPDVLHNTYCTYCPRTKLYNSLFHFYRWSYWSACFKQERCSLRSFLYMYACLYLVEELQKLVDE